MPTKKNKGLATFQKEIVLKELWSKISKIVCEIEINSGRDVYVMSKRSERLRRTIRPIGGPGEYDFDSNHINCYYEEGGLKLGWGFSLDDFVKRHKDGFYINSDLDGEEYFVRFFKKEVIS